MAGKERKHDLSGHVTMTTAMNGYFKEQMNRDASIEVRRKLNMLPQKYSRNPILSEKTPRVDYNGYDFSTPAARPEVKRWEYPENDYGLIRKLPSQKQAFELMLEKEKKYKEEVRRCKELRAEMKVKDEEERTLKSSNSSKRAIAPSASATTTSINNNQSQQFAVPTVELLAARNQETQNQNNTTTRQKKKDKTFYEQPISTFKSLGHENPELLASWRAKRAADYVATLKNPVEPPPMLPMDRSLPFRPGGGGVTLKGSTQELEGTLKKKTTARPKTPKTPVDNAKAQLDTLLAALDSTEREIAFQEQKLKTSNKTSTVKSRRSYDRLVDSDCRIGLP